MLQRLNSRGGFTSTLKLCAPSGCRRNLIAQRLDRLAGICLTGSSGILDSLSVRRSVAQAWQFSGFEQRHGHHLLELLLRLLNVCGPLMRVRPQQFSNWSGHAPNPDGSNTAGEKNRLEFDLQIVQHALGVLDRVEDEVRNAITASGLT